MSSTNWRGKSHHDEEDFAGTGRIDPASRRLLMSLLKGHSKVLWAAVVTLIIRGTAAACMPILVKIGIDSGVVDLTENNSSTTIAWVVIGMVGLAGLQAVAEYISTRLVGRLTQQMLFDLRMRVFDHVQRLGVGFLERFTSGRVIARLTNDMESIDELFNQGSIALVWAFIFISISVIAMFVLDWQLALVATAFGFGLWAISRWYASHALQTSRKAREASAFVIIHFVESLRSVKAVQTFQRQDRNEVILGDVNEKYQQAKQRNTRLVAVYGPGIRLIGNVSVVAVITVGALRIMDSTLTVGTLAAFLLYLNRTIEPFLNLSQFYSFYQAAAAAAEKLSMLLGRQPDLKTADEPTVLVDCRGHVKFSQVVFGYDGTEILHGIDLNIEPGTTVALVGATGAGKSTIARLATRLYDPTQGVVELDGVDLRQLDHHSLRTHVLMVTQENFLFTQTVADNVAFGKPSATREEIEAVLTRLGAMDFVRALPDGLDSHIGKRGENLSNGQRQLLSFARALIADPAVLILDEATASLDVASERRVQHALDEVLADRTAIVIAHRLSTVMNADRIVVVDNGRIAEQGSPGELLQQPDGYYRSLHDEWQRSTKS